MAFDLEAALRFAPQDSERVEISGHDALVAYPALYAKKPTAEYHLLIVIGDELAFNAVVEVSRLMTNTSEVQPSLVMAVESPKAADGAENWARQKFKIADRLVWDARPQAGTSLADLAQRLLQIWPTGRVYGQEMALMKNPVISALAKIMRPLMARRKSPKVEIAAGAILHAAEMDRAFEVFVSLPEGYGESGKNHPLLLVLDSNIIFATSVHAARANMPSAIIVGLGVPRHEGATAFAIRRLEEFSPPVEDYDFKDELGRILTPVFALAGKNLAQTFGAAPKLHRLITGTLLPELQSRLRIDPGSVAIFGHSAGGTYVAYEMLQEGSPFTQYICSSPGLGISGDWLLRQTPLVRPECHYVFGIGSEEFYNDFNVAAGIPRTPDYADRWRQAGASVSMSTFDRATHSSVVPAILADGMASCMAKGRTG